MSRILVWLFVLLCASQAAATEYLRHEVLKLIPKAGNQVATTKPLDPSRRYRITISAAHGNTLSPLLLCATKKFEPPGWFSMPRDKEFCTTKLWFDGQRLPPQLEHTDKMWGYVLFDHDGRHYIPTLEAYIYGISRPLKISIEDDVSYDIPEIRIAIDDIAYLETERLREHQRQNELALLEQDRQESLKREQARLKKEETEARKRQYYQMLKLVFLIALVVVIAAVLLLFALLLSRRRAATARQPRFRSVAQTEANRLMDFSGEHDKTRQVIARRNP